MGGVCWAESLAVDSRLRLVSRMRFSSNWLEGAFLQWRQTASRGATRQLLCVSALTSLSRALAHAPEPAAAKDGALALCALALHLFVMLKPDLITFGKLGAALLLFLDCILSFPGHASLLPALICIFSIYALLLFHFYAALGITIVVSIVQTCAFVLFTTESRTNELLATVCVHVWAHFIGIYLFTQGDRLARSAFLSGRNAVEAETAAEQQSDRLNRLLGSFLPAHLITPARHQIALYNPHIYAEHYAQVTVAYGRLIGFESVLSQCSSLDAARVLKELDQRIDRLAASHGCTRINSEGIMVVCSIPGVDSEHAAKVCHFALDLESLINSFRDATSADVAVCVGVDSGSVAAGVVGSAKWHYDVIGHTVDNAVLLQSNAPAHGVFVTDESRRLLVDFSLEGAGPDCWRLGARDGGSEAFPNNKRFSLVTVPQAINRLLQTVSTLAPTLKNNATAKKKAAQLEEITEKGSSNASFMSRATLRFKNKHMEQEFHKEMDHWFIPAITISIFFLVVYGVYHMLVMPWLITSLVLIVAALCVMFVILLMLYINYFQSFSQFITRTSSGHSVTVLIVLLILFLCGIVNTFSCPPPGSSLSVCRTPHFSALSFSLFIVTSSSFLRFPSLHLMAVLGIACATYAAQVAINHTPIGPKQFGTEFDLLSQILQLAVLVFLHSRKCERLMRLDFLSVVKGVEESSSKDRLLQLNSQVLLNLVPPHVAPWVASKGGELWHHAHHSVGVAYLAVSGFDLHGEQGMNGLNYVFSYFDQALANYRGIEKIKNANRFYIVAVGMLPDAAQNVTETPWTIGELLNTLTQFLIHVTQFATDKEFQVQIGLDCGSALTFVADGDRPRYELWGDTVERSRVLMQSASHERILVSEEIFLALRPRQLNFSEKPVKIMSNLSAYVLSCREDDEATQAVTLPKEEQEKHTQKMYNAAKHDEAMPSSMASSFSSELQSIDDDGETDSDIEWITPETALMQHSTTSSSMQREPYLPKRSNYRQHDYDPYREPYRPGTNYKADQSVQYSDWSEQENSRANSRASSNHNGRNRWRAGSKASLRNPFNWLRKGSSIDVESLADPNDRLEAAATRVDRMIQELNAYGDFADVKPLEYRPFPTAFGSIKSLHRAMSSACHTEYDNNESEAALSDTESNMGNERPLSSRRRRRWRRDGTDADAESQCSSTQGSQQMDPLRWKSVHSVGYENEYELSSDHEGLAIEEMKALSRDIRRNFGDFQLATFDDIDHD